LRAITASRFAADRGVAVADALAQWRRCEWRAAAYNGGMVDARMIRRLHAADAPAWRELMLLALVREPDAFTSDAAESAALPLDWWARRTVDEVVLGAFDDARLAGMVALQPQARLRVRHKAVVSGLYVREDRRGGGLGAALLDAAIDAARARDGLRVLQLQASAHNAAALRLYAARGFVVFGTEPLAVRHGDGFVTKLHLWRPLP
jgi:L-amino acid N-acyltransferase YncA